MKPHSLIKGIIRWQMKKVRVFGNLRIVMLITKGDRAVGHICWHPGAKCLCYDGTYWNTPELMDFVRPYLDKKRFYMAWAIQKNVNEREDK